MSTMDPENDPDLELSGGGSDDEDKKTNAKAGRRKIKIELIQDKSRRHITFSKRKLGIMKKVRTPTSFGRPKEAFFPKPAKTARNKHTPLSSACNRQPPISANPPHIDSSRFSTIKWPFKCIYSPHLKAARRQLLPPTITSPVH